MSNFVKYYKSYLLLSSVDSEDGTTAYVVPPSTTSCTVMTPTQVRYASGNCNPLLQVLALVMHLYIDLF